MNRRVWRAARALVVALLIVALYAMVPLFVEMVWPALVLAAALTVLFIVMSLRRRGEIR